MYVSIKQKKGLLVIDNASNVSMSLVGNYLLNDVGNSGYASWVQWLYDNVNEVATSNYSLLEKEGDFVIVCCQFDEDPYERALTVPIPVMIDLLEQWDAVCKNNPKEVTVYYEDGKFRVEGVY